MLIYGFFGTGKTTFCKEYPEVTIDLDEQFYVSHNWFMTNIELYKGCGGLCFTNSFDSLPYVDIIFIPEHIELVKGRLKKRGNVKKTFLDKLNEDMLIQIKRQYTNKICVLGKREYILTYKDKLLEKVTYPYFPSFD